MTTPAPKTPTPLKAFCRQCESEMLPVTLPSGWQGVSCRCTERAELAALRASHADIVAALADLLSEMGATPNMDGTYNNVRVHHGPRINEAFRKARALLERVRTK